jgi:hypothetical protein
VFTFILHMSTHALFLFYLAVAPATDAELKSTFEATVKPFVARHCVGCHSGKQPAAQLDLTVYNAMADVVRDHAHWATVAERLKVGDMPPKGLPRPDAAASKNVIAWVEAMRANEARKHAGDPGIVLARRLSNAEYNYAIRDLTGVDIRPTREFPVDPANPEGFDNTGESLAMSPALLNKYLQAAREVANHMVLTPVDIAFAPHPMLVETDREKYAIQRIVNFYQKQPTDYADYFLAAWRYQHRVALGKPGATLASTARDSRVSPKYLPQVWAALTGVKERVGPMARVQQMFRAMPAPKKGEGEPKYQAREMRDYVLHMRRLVSKHYFAPTVAGLSTTSQPLMNWKLNQFATKRREFDTEALFEEGKPLPEIPEGPRPGTFFVRANRDIVAVQAYAKLVKARLAFAHELRVPAGKRAEYEAAYGRFARLFPDAFYVSERGRFYPDDFEDQGRLLSAGFHNVMGYFRDDLPLRELVLDAKQTAELDMLWREFDFIANHTIRTYDQYYFNQSGEILGNGRESGSARPADRAITDPTIIFGLRDQYVAKAKADPQPHADALAAIEAHFARVNAEIRAIEKARVESEPLHLAALLRFAARAYRRPLTEAEKKSTLDYYREMRDKSGLTHEEAVRDSLVGILMSPDFCYLIDLNEVSQARTSRQALPGYALASRLSFFLWASPPDEALLAKAASGALKQPAALASEVRRMLKDERARRFVTEFAGNWLDFRRFEEHNTVDRERFPSFDNELREAMFEEPVRLIVDVVRQDKPVLKLLYGKRTFVNPVLARHYGMPDVKGGNENWVAVDNADQYGRGGLLPMAVFLTRNAPGLRTSPVKRGYWVAKRILGERIPPPPPAVPELPGDEAKAELPLRQMLAKHRENPACAGCHQKFDSFGLVFENFGPVGEARTKDLAERAVDNEAVFPDGSKGAGLKGLQQYIREKRQKDFVDQLCRKLLAYGLGRSLLLSDEITIERMRGRLEASGYRFSTLVQTIVESPQFQARRGASASDNQ